MQQAMMAAQISMILLTLVLSCYWRIWALNDALRD